MVPVARETANRKLGVSATESKRTEERDSPKGKTTVAATTAATPSASSPPPPADLSAPEVQRPGLTASEVRAVVGSYRQALDTCVADWRDWLPEADVSGLKVELFITVTPTGAVARGELGNLDVDRSVLGDCLKAVGKKMVFPRFSGEAFTVRVPLVLGQAAQ